LELLTLLGIYEFCRDFSEKYENVQNELFPFILEIIFGFIFIHHSTPILCCATGVGSGGGGAPPKVLL